MTRTEFLRAAVLMTDDKHTRRRLARANCFDVIGGVTQAEMDLLEPVAPGDRAFIVQTWMVRLMTNRLASGGLAVHPALLSRTHPIPRSLHLSHAIPPHGSHIAHYGTLWPAPSGQPTPDARGECHSWGRPLPLLLLLAMLWQRLRQCLQALLEPAEPLLPGVRGGSARSAPSEPVDHRA